MKWACAPAAALAVLVGVAGCGGGREAENAPPPAADTFPVSIAVSGLTGSSVTLRVDYITGTEQLVANGSGNLQTSARLPVGQGFTVDIVQQPSGGVPQHCGFDGRRSDTMQPNGAGVAVVCHRRFTVGGIVNGLQGSGLVLHREIRNADLDSGIPSNEDLSIDGDGAFVFPTAVDRNLDYFVTVSAQPSNPQQLCTVTGGSGSIASEADVSDIVVNCVSGAEKPFRNWQFRLIGTGGPQVLGESPGYPTLIEGGAGAHRIDAGPMPLDFDGDDDKIAHGEVYGSASGRTYWVSAQAPDGRGLVTSYSQRQSFRKLEANARMHFVITEMLLESFDGDIPNPNYNRCPWAGIYGVRADEACFDHNNAEANLSLQVIKATRDSAIKSGGDSYLAAHLLRGRRENWISYTFLDQLPASGPMHEIFIDDHFFLDHDMDRDGTKRHAIVALTEPITVDIDISAFETGEEFTIAVGALAEAINGRAESYTSAHLRDPLSAARQAAAARGMALALELPGLALETSGLEVTNRPYLGEPEVQAAPAPACGSGEDPAGGGVLQFDQPDYFALERYRRSQPILVTRTGGTTGTVQVSVTSTSGSAVPGGDYQPVNQIVTFHDGESLPRRIELPVVLDEIAEDDKTVVLQLSQVAGCATLGARESATVTLIDDDRPPPVTPTYTLGGTISGLAGSGLQIATSGGFGDSPLEPAPGATAFSFGGAEESGTPYEVRIERQPGNPAQVCTVMNGSGAIADANVTNVVIACAAAPPAPIGLDPQFGESGKVFTPMPHTSYSINAGRQSGGGIVVSVRNRVMRYTPGGVLDTSFGTQGVTTLALGGFDGTDEIYGLAVQPDDKIVVVGRSRANASARDDFVVMRMNADGIVDSGFGTGGRVLTDFGGDTIDTALAVAIQSSGRIIVGGNTGTPTSGYDAALAGYLPNGQLDTAFGTNGKVTTGAHVALANTVSTVGSSVDSIRLIEDSILAAGGSSGYLFLAHYFADGGLNPTLTGNHEECDLLAADRSHPGWLLMQTNDGDAENVVGLAVQSGATPELNRYLIGDYRWNGNGREHSFSVVAARPAGYLDVPCDAPMQYPGFGNLVTPLGVSAAFGPGAIVEDLAMQDTERVVLVGGADGDFAIARFGLAAADGQPRPGYLVDALAVDFFGGSDRARAVVVQPDGRIVVVGSVANGTTGGLGIVRINP